MHYEALGIQDRMERGGVSPDIVTYNSLIYGFCREGRMREALRLFREINGATPNHVTYTTLIDGYCRVNDLEEALRLREVMEVEGLTLVLRYGVCNEVKKKMLEAGLKPDQFTFKALIHGFCKLHEVDSAKEFLFEMLDAGFSPSYSTYSWLVDSYYDQDNKRQL
ncbi:Pentatricopeptide repeat-containing protein [Vitis vinifera]|uniref:Pentatricopeptide repeat-containing protein n=1 Tax=Vitis vinifera TaxID=29760 RepID=A0A438EAQ6_VITVI|nr:Pentatricopeptide repeat-containing protein [Vitis vinifera]